MIKRLWILLIVNLLIILASFSQELPLGYIVQYSQDFSGKEALSDFSFSDPGYWRVAGNKSNYYLELSEKPGYADSSGQPGMLAIISTEMYSDFIMELDIMKEGEEQAENGICIVYGFRDPSNYYYVRLASKAIADTHNVFLVRKQVLTKITTSTNPGNTLENKKWNRVKVIRNILEKTITVYLNDMTNPVLTAKDRTLIMGYIGFGTAGTMGKIDNVNIWAPTSVPGDTVLFGNRFIHP
jgi:hypothetical protein